MPSPVLADLLACFGQLEGSCYALWRTRAAAAPAEASQLSWPRLLTIRSGRRKILLPEGERLMEPGVVLLLPPEGWYLPRWQNRCELLSLVFAPGYIRLLRKRISGRPDSRPPDAWWHTARPARGPLRRTLALLLDPRSSAGELHLLRALLAMILDELSAVESSTESTAGVDLYQAVAAYLEENCQEPINRDQVARAFGVHPNHLSRLFARHGEGSFVEQLTQLRMARARRLLRNRELKLEEVAFGCGFEQLPYFLRVFKRVHGQTPGRWRTQS